MEIEAEKKQYAGFWIRFGAYLIDGLIVGIPYLIILMILMFTMVSNTEGFEQLMFAEDPMYVEEQIPEEALMGMIVFYLISFVIGILVSVGYYAGLHASRWQATIGKKLLGLKVTTIQGERISFWRAVGRFLGMQLLSSIFMIGFIMAAFTEKKQSLHDMISGTIVIKK